jgi:hypothetical protein
MNEANQPNQPSQQAHLDSAPPSLLELIERIIIGNLGERNLPKPDSLLAINPETKASVLLALLEQNREEIRFWHEKMFQASFALNSAMVIVTGFVLHEPPKEILSWLAAIACLVFVVFHLVVGRLGTGAIRINGRDLEFIQAALRLAETGDYVKDKPIYQWTGTEWMPQRHFIALHVLNWILATGLIVTLLCRIYC